MNKHNQNITTAAPAQPYKWALRAQPYMVGITLAVILGPGRAILGPGRARLYPGWLVILGPGRARLKQPTGEKNNTGQNVRYLSAIST